MLWTALILGFLGSAHCIVMCGPIAMMVPGAKGKHKITAALLYNGGKILSYVLIGLFFGLATAFVTSFKIQSIITIVGGTIILLLAFTPALLNFAEKRGFQLFNSLINFKNRMSQSLDKNRLEYGLYIGFLNGFIPCGLVYVAAIGAIIQPNLIDTILYMVFFGLGTLPVMSFIIMTSSMLKSKFKLHSNKIKFAGLLLVGCFMLWKGISNYNVEIESPKANESFIICH